MSQHIFVPATSYEHKMDIREGLRFLRAASPYIKKIPANTSIFINLIHQSSYSMAQDPNAPELDMVVYSEHVMAPFKKEFPQTFDLMEYNLMGTLKLLKAAHVLKTKRVHEATSADHSGDDNIRTWAEYKPVIEENLSRMDGLDDSRMAKARPIIAETMHKQYYKKYPEWPKVGKEQTGYVYITCCGTHEASRGQGKWQVTWSCEGGVQVTDRRPSKDQYLCELDGQPTFKILYFDLVKLKTVEESIGQKMVAYKTKVDELHNKDATADKLRAELDALIL